MNAKNEFPPKQQATMLALLQTRFTQHPQRHKGLKWEAIRARLETMPDKLRSLQEMEQTGGEPDVAGHDRATGEYLFFDCSPETPKGRASVCYDRAGWESRKEHRPKTTAMDMAADMGITLLTEDQYFALQMLGAFDRKTSSWLLTPEDIRSHGGALYGECRYDRVFIGHNGAQSYYAVRGFRGVLRV
jgi:Protein of unknown function (DUF4256)